MCSFRQLCDSEAPCRAGHPLPATPRQCSPWLFAKELGLWACPVLIVVTILANMHLALSACPRVLSMLRYTALEG